MGIRAAQWAFQQQGLSDKTHWLLVRLAWSVLDDDAYLGKSPAWLADKCHWTERNLRRHVLALSKLKLVKHEKTGYVLTGFLIATGQNWPLLRSIEGPKLATPLQPPIRKDSIELKNPPTPLRGKSHRELQEFNTAVCEFCDVPHEWKVQEPYSSTFQERMACPEFRATLKGVKA